MLGPQVIQISSGYGIGKTTTESSFVQQLDRYKTNLPPPSQSIPSKSMKLNPSHERLVQKCVSVIVANFSDRPVNVTLPAHLMRAITDRLPVDLDIVVAAKYINDEAYWKRRCIETFGLHNYLLQEHGNLWKQTFIEKALKEKLEGFDKSVDTTDNLLGLVTACADNIFAVEVQQLPSHLDIGDLLQRMPNLTRLNITYGLKKIGMDYDRVHFGLKISDAHSLARSFQQCSNLTTVVLQCNIIDDDLLKMLVTGLLENASISSLDLSHNKVSNHGARLLAKFLSNPDCVLTYLNLADNQIHVEGGRYLGRGLRENTSLLELNVRLNRLTDEGVRMLLEGLQDNITLVQINLAANDAGSDTAQAISALLRDSQHHIRAINLSTNQLSFEDVGYIHTAALRNRSLISVDLRNNPGCDGDGANLLEEIESATRSNELIYFEKCV